jgi:FkbM family methyltransferase
MQFLRSLLKRLTTTSNVAQSEPVSQRPPIDVFSLASALHRDNTQEISDMQVFLQAMLSLVDSGISPRSQLLQECFALSQAPNGPLTFVECGAGRAQFLSNTFVLQQSFGWRGLLIEPNPEFQNELRSERVTESVHLAPFAAGASGEIELVHAGELSTSTTYLESDGHSHERIDAFNAGMVTTVQKIPLNQLLIECFGKPGRIGFLSVDVEGAEMDVLQSLDWSQWSFNAITVEHNNRTSFAEELDSYLASHGYRRFLNGSTQWDAWYVPMSHS